MRLTAQRLGIFPRLCHQAGLLALQLAPCHHRQRGDGQGDCEQGGGNCHGKIAAVRLLLLPLLSLPALPAQAAPGWELSGKNRAGQTVSWGADITDLSLDEYRDKRSSSTVVVKGVHGALARYGNQVCSHAPVNGRQEFTCEDDGRSPLSKAVYVIKSVGDDCSVYQYLLKPGTGNRDAPAFMQRSPWQCPFHPKVEQPMVPMSEPLVVP